MRQVCAAATGYLGDLRNVSKSQHGAEKVLDWISTFVRVQMHPLAMESQQAPRALERPTTFALQDLDYGKA